MWNMEYLFRVLLMLFSSLVSRGKEIRMVNIADRIKASCIKIVRLVLETESGWGGWICLIKGPYETFFLLRRSFRWNISHSLGSPCSF